MPVLDVEFHPEAEKELLSARDWYADRSTAAAEQFIETLTRAVASIRRSPSRWPFASPGIRRYLMRRFPFLVFYRLKRGSLQILAVAHAYRRPGYWKNRR